MIYKFDADEWKNTSEATPGEFTRMPAGGYVCKIVSANFAASKQGNDMLIFNVDVAEGDFADYFQSTVKRFNQTNWPNPGVYRQLIFGNDNKISPFFKGLIHMIEQCNPGFVAMQNGSIDSASFVGKLCGFVFGDEEYPKRDGSPGIRAAVCTPKTIGDIRDGNFKIPPLKKLDANKAEFARKVSYAPTNDSPDVSPIYEDDDPPFL